VQPAEERIIGAQNMKNDGLWERFGTPDYALAFHVSSQDIAGIINVSEGSPYAGADTVDIVIHGVGTHCQPLIQRVLRHFTLAYLAGRL
jgi:hippurate hydrolase